MREAEIIEFVRQLDGVAVVTASEAGGAPEAAWGHSFFFYDPDLDIPDDRRFPFATIVTSDYEGFDTSSNLNRPGVFRVNIWVSRATFAGLFDPDEPEADPTALDTAIPHPVYGKQSWVSILNPDTTSDLLRSLLTEAHDRAVQRHSSRA